MFYPYTYGLENCVTNSWNHKFRYNIKPPCLLEKYLFKFLFGKIFIGVWFMVILLNPAVRVVLQPWAHNPPSPELDPSRLSCQQTNLLQKETLTLTYLGLDTLLQRKIIGLLHSGNISNEFSINTNHTVTIQLEHD